MLEIESSWGSDSFSYSGRLVNTDGSPVTGPVNLRAELAYSNSTSTILCSQDLSSINLSNGVFHIKLELDCSPKTITQILAETPATHSVAIRITDVTHGKAYSFQALHSMPYSNVSKQLVQMGATDGQVLTWDNGEWKPLTPSGTSSGSIGTTELADGSVTDPKVATGISRSKLATGVANYVLVNDGSGYVSETPFLSITQGGTGATTVAGIFTNLGLGTAATADLGLTTGNALAFDDVKFCLPTQKLMLTALPTVQWICEEENASNDTTKLPLAGGTMTGDINMNTNRIIGLDAPVDPDEAVNKTYVDTLSESNWKSSGTNAYYNNTGNVGVGVTTPAEKLDVVGNVALTGGARFRSGSNYVELKAPTLASNVLLVLPAADGTAGQILKTDGAGNLGWVDATAGSITTITANLPLTATTSSGSTTLSVNYDGATIGMNGSNQLHVTNGGINNAQIGASAAIDWTKINKTGSAPSDIGAASELVSITAGSGLLGGGTLEASRTLSVNVGTSANQIVQMDGTGKLPAVDGSQLTNLPLKWVDATGGINYPSGNVGIGTTTPMTPLDVVGGDGSGATIRNAAESSSTLQLFTAGGGTVSRRAKIQGYRDTVGALPLTLQEDGGNVGIGTITPTAQLHLKDGTGIKVQASNAQIEFADSTTSIFQRMDGSGNLMIEKGDHSNILTVLQTGQLGIGTVTPGFSLDVGNKKDAIRLPVGTTTERPAAPANGVIRYNSDNNKLEAYVAGMWQDLAAAATGGTYLSTGGGTLSGALTISSGGADIAGGINVNSGAIINTGNITGSSALTVAAGGTNQNLTLNSSGTGSVNIGSGGGNAMTVLSSGNIGVGTAAPGSLLHIKKDHNSETALKIENADTGSSAYAGINFINDVGATSYIYLGSNTYSSLPAQNRLNVQAGSGTTGLSLQANGAGDDIRFLTGGINERMRIDGNGNVGIGTASPGSKLDIAGSVRIRNTHGLGFGRDNGNTDFSTYIDAGNYPSQGYNTSDMNYWVRMASKGGTHIVLNTDGGAGSVENSYDHLTVWQGAVDGDKLFSVTNAGKGYFSGNVGIGTTNPATTLHVAGATYAGTGATFPIAGDYHQFIAPSSHNDSAAVFANYISSGFTNSVLDAGVVQTSGSGFYLMRLFTGDGASNPFSATQFVVRGDGNVGIGTNSPQSKLDVAGTIRATELCDEVGSNCKDISLGWGTTSSASMISSWPDALVCDDGTDRSILYHDTRENATSRVWYSKASGGATHYVRFDMTTGAYVDGTAYTGNSVCNGKSISTLSSEGRTFGLLGGGVDWTVAGTNVYRSGGNVGIGTTAPTAKLEIEADGTLASPGPYPSESRLYVESMAGDGPSTDTGVALFRVSAQRIASADTYSANARLLEVANDNGTQFIVRGNGNVGIGTTSPAAQLHLAKGGDPTITIFETNAAAAGNKGKILFTARRSSDTLEELLGYIQGVSEDGVSKGGLRFVSRNNADVETMRITSAGYVGIGMTNPSNKLHVAGSIGATGWIGAGCETNCSTDAYAINYADGRIVTYDGTTSCTKLGGSGTFSCSSDERLKNTIIPFNHGLDYVLKLKPKTYYWNNDKDRILNYGFIAQEVQKVVPHAVTEQERPDGVFLSIDQGAFTPYIINAIKDLNSKVEENKKMFEFMNKGILVEHGRRIASLEEENRVIKEENAKIKEENKMIKAFLCKKYADAEFCENHLP